MSNLIKQILDAIEFLETLERTIEDSVEDMDISAEGFGTTGPPERQVPELEPPIDEDVWTRELQTYQQIITEREAQLEEADPVMFQSEDTTAPILSKVEYGPSIRYAIKSPPHNPQSINPWLIGFGFWCDSVGISQKDYLGLIELFDVAKIDDLKGLPRTPHTFQRRYREHLPFTAILEKTIPLQTDKIPTGQITTV